MKPNDGRKRSYIIPQRKPTVFRNSEVKMVIDAFTQYGCTTHSGLALTLQYVIDHCEENNIPYRIDAIPGKRYGIQRMKLTEKGFVPDKD